MSNICPKSQGAPFLGSGALIHAFRNEIKHSRHQVAQGTGIDEKRIEAFEAGKKKPRWRELQLLATHFHVSLRDLLPSDNDLDRGTKISRRLDERRFDQKRGGRLQYSYWPKVMTSTLPHIKPVELLLHLHKREDVVLNNGHFYHQYTQVLSGGPVACLWRWQSWVHEEILEEGDSWLIPGFVPHGFYSPDSKQVGRILAITFGQHLTGDARLELELIGRENAGRVVSDDSEYYP